RRRYLRGGTSRADLPTVEECQVRVASAAVLKESRPDIERYREEGNRSGKGVRLQEEASFWKKVPEKDNPARLRFTFDFQMELGTAPLRSMPTPMPMTMPKYVGEGVLVVERTDSPEDPFRLQVEPQWRVVTMDLRRVRE